MGKTIHVCAEMGKLAFSWETHIACAIAKVTFPPTRGVAFRSNRRDYLFLSGKEPYPSWAPRFPFAKYRPVVRRIMTLFGFLPRYSYGRQR